MCPPLGGATGATLKGARLTQRCTACRESQCFSYQPCSGRQVGSILPCLRSFRLPILWRGILAGSVSPHGNWVSISHAFTMLCHVRDVFAVGLRKKEDQPGMAWGIWNAPGWPDQTFIAGPLQVRSRNDWGTVLCSRWLYPLARKVHDCNTISPRQKGR